MQNVTNESAGKDVDLSFTNVFFTGHIGGLTAGAVLWAVIPVGSLGYSLRSAMGMVGLFLLFVQLLGYGLWGSSNYLSKLIKPSVLRAMNVSIYVAAPFLGWVLIGSSVSGAPILAYGMTFVWYIGGWFIAIIAGFAALYGAVVFFDGFIVNPVAWLMGSKERNLLSGGGSSAAALDATQSSGVAAAQSSSHTNTVPKPDQAVALDVPVSRPTLTMDALAGMADVKRDLAPVLNLFRGYAKNAGPIADRNGILLSGPPGNGKTTFAEAIAGELGLPLIKIKGSDIQSRWINQTGEQVAALFRLASKEPCVLFFDEFETIAFNRGNASGHQEDRKAVTALLPELDEARRKRIVVVAATNYADQIDSAIARDGRFDFRIEIPYPDFEARVGVLTGMLRKYKVDAAGETVDYVAKLWERRSVAFIESTVKRLRDSMKTSGQRIAGVDAFKQASRESSRRSSNIPSSGSKLSELALTTTVREETNSLLYRLRNWEKISERGGEPPSGVLLYGPPGTGKTNLVRALARELGDWHVFEVNATDVIQDPRKFRSTVEMAGEHRPAIIFIDEADELLRERIASNNSGATNEILKCMDGMMGKVPEVLFMAATNNAEFMDAAALRGGRFAEKIYMGKLTGDDLVRFLEKAFSEKSNVRFDDDLTPQSLATMLHEAAPADALTVLRKAINYTFGMDGGHRAVSMVDIEKAIGSTTI